MTQLLWFAINALLSLTSAQMTTSFSASPTAGEPPTTPPPTHSPIPSLSLPPLPPTFSDVSSAVDCWNSHITYSFSSTFLSELYRQGHVWSTTSFTSPITETSTYGYSLERCSTIYAGLTTLCDGYPRANDCSTTCSSTGYTSWTKEFTLSTSGRWLTPTWSTELTPTLVPTCTEAKDFSPECSRLVEGYSWLSSQIVKITATATATETSTAWVNEPHCVVSIPPTVTAMPPAKQRCSLKADSYEAYYWPTATATNTNAFCSPNATAPTATPTIPGRPNTAVVSGLTLTSPSLYHILHNATVFTYIGQKSTAAWGIGDPIYGISSVLPTLTYSQPPSPILSMSTECHKPSPHGATRCTLSYNPDFLIQDLFTVNAKAYYGDELPTPTMATICQTSYSPTIGMPLGEIAKQNEVGEDCEWTFSHSGRTTVLDRDMYSVSEFTASDYHAITAGAGEGPSTRTAQPGSGTTSTGGSAPTGVV
ncbi:hypothetical protein DM02DRAFT_653336 [Periconia macrospinosa]|uniref:Uncharacterized protein n=1 Tax=Periconia macrospinosa TaxID=97972 RepID=A0A2V1DWE6_9PLEO|nr:hypothetical protein DM02DRAFT_653336 [Periconia macrospinosa]